MCKSHLQINLKITASNFKGATLSINMLQRNVGQRVHEGNCCPNRVESTFHTSIMVNKNTQRYYNISARFQEKLF